MFEKMIILFIAMSLASCVPVTGTTKSKIKFGANDKKESNEIKPTNTYDSSIPGPIDTPALVKPIQTDLKISVKKILVDNCLSCHGDGKKFQILANLAPDISEIEKDTSLISPGDLKNSNLYQQVTVGSMKAYLKDSTDAEIIRNWIITLVKEVPQVPKPIEVADIKAPVISSFLPNGTVYESNINSLTLSAVTDEVSSCSFSATVSNLDFNKMTKFTVTGDKAHSHPVSKLSAGNYSYFIKCIDTAKNISLEKEIKFSIKAVVVVDTKAPLISSYLPNGTIFESNINSATLSAITDEASMCSFSTNVSKLDYSKMTKFAVTGDKIHSHPVSKLSAGNYSYFIKCIDTAKNISLEKEIKFSIKAVVVVKLTTAELKTAVQKIFNVNCLSCHGDGQNYQSFADLGAELSVIEKDTTLIRPNDLKNSNLYQKIAFGSMKKYLSSTKDQDIIKDWILSLTPDTKAPLLSSLTPNGTTYDITVKSIKLGVVTDEAASCSFSNTIMNLDYSKMVKFLVTGDKSHSHTINNLGPGKYSYFVRCIDLAKNLSLEKEIKFSIDKDAVIPLPIPVIKLTTAQLKVAVRKILDTNCLSCHGAGKSFQDIANLAPSISDIEKNVLLVSPGNLKNSFLYQQITVGKMKVYIKDSKDIDTIKDWILSLATLVAPAPPPIKVPVPVIILGKPGFKDYQSELQMGNRSYVESVLLQVFDAADTTAASYIQTDIYQRIEFGGACDLYSASDVGISTSKTAEFVREKCTNNIGVVQIPNNNPMRYSITTKVCEKLVTDTDRLISVRNKIYTDKKWGAPTDDKVLVAWHLFHQASDANADVVKSLKDISKVTKTSDEAWKIIILTLCMSPEWQAM